MDALPKTSVLPHVASFCGARSLGTLGCVGSPPLQSVALAAWRPLLSNQFPGEHAAPGQARRTYAHLFRARQLLRAEHGPAREDPLPPPRQDDIGRESLGSVRFLIKFDGCNKIDGALSMEALCDAKRMSSGLMLKPRPDRTTYNPSLEDVRSSLLAMTDDRFEMDPGYEDYVCDLLMRFRTISLVAMREDGASARIATWNDSERWQWLRFEEGIERAESGRRVIDLGLCSLDLERVGLDGPIQFKSFGDDSDGVGSYSGEVVDICARLCVHLFERPGDQFGATTVAGAESNLDGTSDLSFEVAMTYMDGEDSEDSIMLNLEDSAVIHFMLDRSPR